MKERLDVLVVSRGLAPSREKAKAIIMAGNVLVDGQREDKAGSMFKDTVEITVKGHTLCQQRRTETGESDDTFWCYPERQGMYGCRCFYRRIYRLYAAKWCGKGIFY